jgi:hypothetical protein
MSGRENRFGSGVPIEQLPSFRRPNYVEMITKANESEHKWATEEVVNLWTSDDKSFVNPDFPVYYHINHMLRQDDMSTKSEPVVQGTERDNASFIFALKDSIKSLHDSAELVCYRGLRVSQEQVNHYLQERLFLWSTFSASSFDKDLAREFAGDDGYVFECVMSSRENHWTYKASIANYSKFDEEKEVLIYPYSGFEVVKVNHEEKMVTLQTIDTLVVEKEQKAKVPKRVLLWDPLRSMFVLIFKNTLAKKTQILWKPVEQEEWYIIAQNTEGYWDSPYRYKHDNGFFVNRLATINGLNYWEEVQAKDLHAEFLEVTQCLLDDGETVDSNAFKPIMEDFEKFMESRKKK